MIAHISELLACVFLVVDDNNSLPLSREIKVDCRQLTANQLRLFRGCAAAYLVAGTNVAGKRMCFGLAEPQSKSQNHKQLDDHYAIERHFIPLIYS